MESLEQGIPYFLLDLLLIQRWINNGRIGKYSAAHVLVEFSNIYSVPARGKFASVSYPAQRREI